MTLHSRDRGRPGPGLAGIAKREDSYGPKSGPKAGSRASSPGEQAAACDCRKTRALGYAGLLILKRLGLLRGLFDGADVHEGLLGEVVPLAFEEFLEAAHGVAYGDVLAWDAREHLGYVERLAEEALEAPRALHGQLVLVTQRVEADDGAAFRQGP